MKGPSICYGDNGGDGSGGGGGSSGNGNGGGYGGSGSYSDSTFVVGPNGEGWEEYVKKYGAKWEKLSLAEKEFVRNHPYVAICFYKNSQRAISLSQILYPGSQVRSRQDAFRHAYWSALNAYEQGESLARQFGNAHEEEDERAIIMDMKSELAPGKTVMTNRG